MLTMILRLKRNRLGAICFIAIIIISKFANGQTDIENILINDSSDCDKVSLQLEPYFGKFSYYVKKSKISRSFKIAYKNENEERFRLKNPNRAFRKTDVVTFLGTKPNKRLVFVAIYSSYQIIVYERGGVGFSTRCSISRKDKSGKTKILCDVSLKSIDNYEKLLAAFEHHSDLSQE